MPEMLNLDQLDAMEPTRIARSRADLYADTLFSVSDDEIEKALASGSSVGTDASSLIGESLDNQIKDITLDPRTFAPITKRMFTFNAKALVEEYNRLESLGLSDESWRREGALGPQDASSFVRRTEQLRYFGQVGAVTHGMLRAAEAKYGNLKAIEATNRLRKLTLDLERNIMHGNSALQPLSWRGLLQQAPSTSEFVTDLAQEDIAGSRTVKTAGGTLTSDKLRELSENPLAYGGLFTACYLPPGQKIQISKAEDSNLRYYAKDQVSAIAKGMRVDQILTDFGINIDLVWNFWLKYPRGKQKATPKDPTGTFHSEAPVAIAAALAAAAASGGYLPVDTYYVSAAYKNHVGEGPLKLLSTGVTTTNTNGKINVTVTHNVDLSNVDSIVLYVSTTNGTDYSKHRVVGELAVDKAKAGTTEVFEIDGSTVPGSGKAFLTNEYMQASGILEAPVMWDLPRLDNTHRFSIDGIANVMLYAEEHTHTINNLGSTVVDPA